MDANHHLQTRLYRCLCAQSESIEIMMSDSLIHFQTLCNSQGAPCASVRAEGGALEAGYCDGFLRQTGRDAPWNLFLQVGELRSTPSALYVSP